MWRLPAARAAAARAQRAGRRRAAPRQPGSEERGLRWGWAVRTPVMGRVKRVRGDVYVIDGGC